MSKVPLYPLKAVAHSGWPTALTLTIGDGGRPRQISCSGTGIGRNQRGTTRVKDAQETPTQSHILPSILVYEDTSSSICLEWSSECSEGTATKGRLFLFRAVRLLQSLQG